MATDRIEEVLTQELAELEKQGSLKGREQVITKLLPAAGDEGPRYLLEGEGDRRFLRMNSNSYLGMSLRHEIIEAEERAARAFGTGPGAVRFISGTYHLHIELERRLAEFHGREACMIFSSAYATSMGVLPPLITAETVVISDALNHNCIINAMRLARPQEKKVYSHLDLGELESQISEAAGKSRRVIVVTDGIFSMRGDHAPLSEIMAVARKYDDQFPENVLVVADDSHGVGAFGETGRGTEEYTGGEQVDLLIATLGKALGVNGGYVVGSQRIIGYLREKSPFYIYSNPITPAEAAAACAAVALLAGPRGRELLDHLRSMTRRFEQGLLDLGFETIPGEHPVVPLMVRDTAKTSALVEHLFANGILATGLNFPVVPKGDEEIRFQVSADHTAADIDHSLRVLADFAG
jgi:glycine C-acetyltransferase